MNDEVTEMKINNLEEKINTLEKIINDLPDKINNRLDENIKLKIENAKQEIKLDFYKWLVPIILGLLFSMGGVIFNFIK